MHDGAAGFSTPAPEVDDVVPGLDACPSSAQVRRLSSNLHHASLLVVFRPLILLFHRNTRRNRSKR